jgi:hypothetical protein
MQQQQDEDSDTTSSQQPSSTPSKCIIQSQYQYGSLPPHLVVEIFSYLIQPHLAGEKLISESKNDWPLSYLNYAQVCKNWYDCARHDSLWKNDTLRLYEHARTYTGNKQQLYTGEMLKNGARQINKNNVSISYLVPEQCPSSDYFSFYCKLRAMQAKEFSRLQFRENRRARIISFLSLVEQKKSLIQATLYTGIYVLLMLFLGLLTLHQIIGMNRLLLPVIFSPIFLSLILLAILFFIYLLREGGSRFRYEHFEWTDMKWSAIIFTVIIILLFLFVLMVVMNVGVLPLLPDVVGSSASTWDRRWSVIPWHVVFMPIFLLLCAPMLVCLLFFLTQAYEHICACRWAHINYWWLLGFDTAATFFLSFVLWGFHLEFPKAFHIGYTFIPLYLLELVFLCMFVFFSATHLKKSCVARTRVYIIHTRYRFDILLALVIAAFPVNMIISHVAMTLVETIHGFAYLSLVLPLTNVFVVLFMMQFEDAINAIECCSLTACCSFVNNNNNK